MKLPGGDTAVIPPGKLIGYSLMIDHPRGGGDKARVFRAALGLGPENAEVLEGAFLKAAREGEAVLLERTEYGDVYYIDFVLEFRGRSAEVRSGWIVPADGSATRLTTCFVNGKAP